MFTKNILSSVLGTQCKKISILARLGKFAKFIWKKLKRFYQNIPTQFEMNNVVITVFHKIFKKLMLKFTLDLKSK